MLLVGAACLTWTALGRWRLPHLGSKQYDYYNLLVAGFRKGSLALDIEVPAALKEAKDPMALFRASPDIAPHDLSLYRGHFYSYYGVVPAVVLYLPFRILAGCDLPLVVGSLVFSLGALLLAGWLWMRVIRDHFHSAGILTEAGGAAVLGLAAGQWVLVRRVSIWEPSIIAGHFFLMAMLAASYQALRGHRPVLWLGVAGACVGLAAGSRPTLVVAGLGLVPLVWAVADVPQGTRRGRALLRAVLAVGVSLGVVGALLLYYNWARFGNPLELGLNHQLSTWNEEKKSHFRPSFIPFNFYLYFLAAPQWGRYFPFVHPIAMPKLPANYYGYEYVYGALLLCPALWWGAFSWRLARGGRGTLFWFAAVLAGMAMATTPVILCFDTSAARYATDFLPWWTWVALLGWCAVEKKAAGSPLGLGALRTAFGATAVVSCATAFFCSADLHGILEQDNPGALAQLGRVFNQPTALWERASGYTGGAVTMDVTFADKPIESVEPLIVTGVEYQRDYVYVYYQNMHVVRLVYLHPGEPAAESGDIEVVPGRSYPVEISCGALYPPAGHPEFSDWSEAEVQSVKHWARIVFDGKVVVSDARGAHEASPGTFQFGKDDGIGFCGRRFAGTVAHVRNIAWKRPIGDLSGSGDLEVEFVLSSQASGLPMPLFEIGREGSADIAGIRNLGNRSVALTYESYGFGLWQSPPLAPPKDSVQSLRLRVRLGSEFAFGKDDPLSIVSKSAVFWRDGLPVWWHRSQSKVDVGGTSWLLSNGVHSTAMSGTFSGQLISMRRLPAVPAWKPGKFSRLRLQLGGRGEGTEPLVCTGQTGRADVLGIEWLPGNRARLIYDHWGEALQTSRPFDWASQASGTFLIAMPSLAHLGDKAAASTGPIEVSLDSHPIWNAEVPYYAAGPNEVAVGRNPVGSSVTVAELRSAVLDVEQEP